MLTDPCRRTALTRKGHVSNQLLPDPQDLATLNQPLSLAPMATAHRPCQRFALMGLIGAFLAGCSQGGSSLPRVLRIAKSSTDPGGLDVEASVRDRRVVKDVQALLQDFDPGLRLHPTSYSELNLVREIARQTSSGLGPDLIITNGNTALALQAQQLTQPVPLTPEEPRAFPPWLFNESPDRTGPLPESPSASTCSWLATTNGGA